MTRRRNLHLIARTLVPLLATTVAAQSGSDTRDPDRPHAREILDRALERSVAQDESGRELDFVYIVDSAVDTLDGDGAVTKTETARSRRYEVEGQLYEELLERDGEPLDEDEVREQEKERAEFAREAREHRDGARSTTRTR